MKYLKQNKLERSPLHTLRQSTVALGTLIFLSTSQPVIAQEHVKEDQVKSLSALKDLVTTPGPDKQNPRLVTVEELMHLDAQAALRMARRHQFDERSNYAPRPASSGSQSREAEATQSGAPVVQAIYGIGRALTAEVQIGQDIHVLRKQKHRVPITNGQVLVLERIDPPCVHLKRDSQVEILCLNQTRP